MGKRKKIHIENLFIEKYAAEGKCVARYEDKIIFVEGGVPGDIVNVYVTKNKKDWAEAIVTKIVQLSENRVVPFCQHFGICGGCKWQMLPYHLQLEYKEQQVKDQMQRIGHVKIEKYLPIVGCEEIINYRNKLEFTFSTKQYLPTELLKSHESFDKNVLGFHAPRLFDKVIDIENCHLQPEPSNAIKNFIREFAFQNHLTFYDIRNHHGLLRTLMIRVASTKEVLVNVVFGENQPNEIQHIMNAIQKQFPEITSLHYTINTKMNDTIYDQEIICVSSVQYIQEKLGDYTFKISPKSFFQTNPKQTTTLYNTVKEFADCQGNEILYDLYCGTGSIGIYLSKNVRKIIGVESVGEAIEDAKLNADLNQLKNTFYFTGDVIKICDQSFFQEHGKPDVIVIDPPRAGCHSYLLDKLLEIESPKIIYVSCNPATQARDLQILQTKYHLIKSQAVDMFPQTHHIENVVLLHLKSE